MVVVVDKGSTEKPTLRALKQVLLRGWQIVHQDEGAVAMAKNVGIRTILSSGASPLGFVFLSATDQLFPEFIAACEAVFRQCPEVGLVSCWTDDSMHKDKILIRPCPSFPVSVAFE